MLYSAELHDRRRLPDRCADNALCCEQLTELRLSEDCGFGVSGNPIRVGNLLGAGLGPHARFSARVGGSLQGGFGIAVSLLWCYMAPVWAQMFGLSPEGAALLVELMPYAFGLYVGIAIGCGALRSILTGMALVRIPSIVQVRTPSLANAFFCSPALLFLLLGAKTSSCAQDRFSRLHRQLVDVMCRLACARR